MDRKSQGWPSIMNLGWEGEDGGLHSLGWASTSVVGLGEQMEFCNELFWYSKRQDDSDSVSV